MLAVVSQGIIAVANWFDLATAFPPIGTEFKAGLGSLSYLISLHIVGYGLTHIPGGMLAAAIGMTRTLMLGLLVQGRPALLAGRSRLGSRLLGEYGRSSAVSHISAGQATYGSCL